MAVSRARRGVTVRKRATGRFAATDRRRRFLARHEPGSMPTAQRSAARAVSDRRGATTMNKSRYELQPAPQNCPTCNLPVIRLGPHGAARGPHFDICWSCAKVYDTEHGEVPHASAADA